MKVSDYVVIRNKIKDIMSTSTKTVSKLILTKLLLVNMLRVHRAVEWTLDNQWNVTVDDADGDTGRIIHEKQILSGFNVTISKISTSSVKIEFHSNNFEISINFTEKKSAMAWSTHLNISRFLQQNSDLISCIEYDTNGKKNTTADTFLLTFTALGSGINDTILAVGTIDDFHLIFIYANHRNRFHNSVMHFTIANKVDNSTVQHVRILPPLVSLLQNKAVKLSEFSNCGTKGVYSYRINRNSIKRQKTEETVLHHKPVHGESIVLGSKLQFSSTTIKILADRLQIHDQGNFRLEARPTFQDRYQLATVRVDRFSYQSNRNPPCRCCHQFQLRLKDRPRSVTGIRIHYSVWKFVKNSLSYERKNFNVTILNLNNRFIVNYDYKCDQGTGFQQRKQNRKLTTLFSKLPCNVNLCHSFKNDHDVTKICVIKTTKMNCDFSWQHVIYRERRVEAISDSTRTRLMLLTSGSIISVMIVTSFLSAIYVKKKSKWQKKKLMMETISFYEEIDERCNLLYERYL